MTETSSTINHPAGVITSAMRALADHVDEHHLPAPVSTRFDREADEIKIYLVEADADVWVDTLFLDRVYDETYTTPGHASVHLYRIGRLPVGVRVEIVTVHLLDLVGASA